MNAVQVEQKSYEMPPREGITIAYFLTVADVERSARYYEKVFGARILTMGDGNAPPYLQLANIGIILNVGGGPTPDKPTVTLSVPDPNHISSFMNFRVADIQACYELWEVEAPSSSRSQYRSTARFAATSAILTVILSRSDKAPLSSTVKARPGWDSDLNGCGCSLEAFRAASVEASTLVSIGYVRPTDSSSRIRQFCFEQSLALTHRRRPAARGGVVSPCRTRLLPAGLLLSEHLV